MIFYIPEYISEYLLRCKGLLHLTTDMSSELKQNVKKSFELHLSIFPSASTSKSLNFAGIKLHNLRGFWPFREILYHWSFKTTKSRSHIPVKLKTYRVWDSVFPNISSKYDISISVYSNKNRISVTYLITITLINNRKIDMEWLLFLIFSEIAKLNIHEMFYNHQLEWLNTNKMYFFSNHEIKSSRKWKLNNETKNIMKLNNGEQRENQ